MIVEIDKIINEFVGLLERLDIKGVMPYSLVRLKYPCEVYWNPWPLWSCNLPAATFSVLIARRMISSTRFTVCCEAD